MSKTSIYLNFNGNTEEAFSFYKTVFGTDFIGNLVRNGDMPKTAGFPELSDQEKDLIMHVALPILGGIQLMGTDVLESMGMKVTFGNNVFINLEPDTREETYRLFKALSEGGKVDMELQEMFWGDYFGSCQDKFGVRWMFNCASKE